MLKIFEKYNIEKNKPIGELSRFKCGGNAEYYFEPKNQEELVNFLDENGEKLKITVIGGGTNILIRDKGIKGVLINTKRLNRIKVEKDKIVCEAGVSSVNVYIKARDNSLANYEFLGTIPGTIGGACKMNAGCYGFEIKDVMLGVKTVDFLGNIEYFPLDKCSMEYRKNNLPENLIFLEVHLKITEKTSIEEIEKKFKENLEKRERSQPYYENTCGSTFKNPEEMPAWKVIQELNLQGVDFNGAKFSEKHANFIVNYNNAKSADIEDLIKLAIKEAKYKKNITLTTEVKILGDE